MRTILFCAAAMAASAFVSGARSQQPLDVTPDSSATPPTSLLAGPVPIHTAEPEAGETYGTWGAVEPHFKVSFHGDMTFIPYLGRDYPQNQPWSWRTVSVTCGNHVLVAAGMSPERSHTETRYEYRFGPITESYELRTDGLEQTFVIDKRPPARGDLVVHGRIDTALESQVRPPSHGALVFRDHTGTDIVSYGEAFVFDANGTKDPITTAFDGERITLTVSGAFLEEAAFPVTIDPLLSRQSIAYSDPVIGVDVCRDDTANQVMFVYSRATSILDFDVYARIASDDLTSSTSVYSDVTTQYSSLGVACATADSPQKYCLVFLRNHITGTSGIHLRYQVRAAGVTTFSTVYYSIYPSSGAHYTNPDVGGTILDSSGDNFLLVWQTELVGLPDVSRIYAAPLNVDAVTGVNGCTLGAVFEINRHYPNGDAERPSINQTTIPISGGRTTWMVCWQEWSNYAGEQAWDISMRQVSESGTVSSTGLTLGASRQKLGPKIAGLGSRYAVIYGAGSTTQMPGKVVLANAHGVDLKRVDWTIGGSTITTKPSVRIVDSDLFTTRRWNVNGIGFDHWTRSHWAYHLRNSGGITFVGRVGSNGQVTEGPLVTVDGPPSSSTVAGGITFDDDHNRWVLGWGKGSDVRGNHFVYRTPNPVSLSGTSCGSAVIQWYGNGSNQQIGCADTRINLTSMPSNALSLVAVGLRAVSIGMPSPPFASGCYQSLDPIGTTNLAIGSTAYFAFPIPEFLARDNIYFQGFYTNTAGTRFYSTRRLMVPIIK